MLLSNVYRINNVIQGHDCYIFDLFQQLSIIVPLNLKGLETHLKKT